MATEYSRGILRIAIAQICQHFGWNAVQTTPMELLTDVLERYILAVGTMAHRYSEQYGRTEPNLTDLGLAFRDYNVNTTELMDYLRQVDPIPFVAEVPSFPIPRPNELHFPKANSRELLEREEHIHEYLPPMNPQWDDEIITPADKSGEAGASFLNGSEESAMQISPIVPPGGDKRQLQSPTEVPPAKKLKMLPEEAGHSHYEMKGVVMSAGGFLTPMRGQGKLPDAKTPPKASLSVPSTPTTAELATGSPFAMLAPRLPSLPSSTPMSPITHPSVISETIEERTTVGDYEEFEEMKQLRLMDQGSSFESIKDEVGDIPHGLVPPVIPSTPGLPSATSTPQPTKPTKARTGAKKPAKAKAGTKAAKKTKAEIKAKPKDGEGVKTVKTPKGGKSPAKAKGSKTKKKVKNKGDKSKLQTVSLMEVPVKPEVESYTETPMDLTVNKPSEPPDYQPPALVKSPSPDRHNRMPLLTNEMKSEPPVLTKMEPYGSPLQGDDDVDSPEPKLVIAEEEAKQLEAKEALKQRLAAIDDTIDDVIKQSMEEMDNREMEEKEPVKPDKPKTDTLKPFRLEWMKLENRNPEEQQKTHRTDRRMSETIDDVIRRLGNSPMHETPIVTETLPQIQSPQPAPKKKTKQQRAMDKQIREAKIMDTIDDVIRRAASPSPPLETPQVEKDIYTFADEEDSFSIPPTPQTPTLAPKSPKKKKVPTATLR